MNGATGIWCSVCTEGAMIGHVSSCNTIINLVRLGNTKVLKRYNCRYLRKAAINVTRLTTGSDPHPKQAVYGDRALDFVFDLGRYVFDMAEFFDEKPPMRITTLTTPENIVKQLVHMFGEDDQFTVERTNQMLEVILEDLRHNRSLFC